MDLLTKEDPTSTNKSKVEEETETVRKISTKKKKGKLTVSCLTKNIGVMNSPLPSMGYIIIVLWILYNVDRYLLYVYITTHITIITTINYFLIIIG